MRAGILARLFSRFIGGNRSNDAAADLVGTWRLQSVADQPPVAISIQDYEAEFMGDGTWNYHGTLTGRFAGTSIQGAGTWKLAGKFLHYSAGASSGRTCVAIADSILTLSPDPVVMVDGTTEAITKYERAK